jgi:protein SCO1/2
MNFSVRHILTLSGQIGLTACAALLCSGAMAQVHPNLNRYSVDPISFRGPDPAKRFKDIEIVQKLDAQLPIETLKYRNEKGEEVSLKDCMIPGRPVVLAMVYYDCPSICNQVLNGVIAACDAADIGLEMGQDFTTIAVSINPNENAELAAAKKSNYLKNYHRAFGNEGLRFLTGDQEQISTLANLVGFRYFYEEATKQYAHAAGIMILTPEGRVSSYYFGLEYLPKRLGMALIDASGGKIGSLVARLQLLCYHYDPSVGAYGFYVMYAVRIIGGMVLSGIALFWLVQYVYTRRFTAKIGPTSGADLGGGLAGQP